ncbi:MAG: hypothetical protein WDM77_10470 [Steroidobacteraceae bacterium]
MKRNEPPQIAPSSVSSMAVVQGCCGADVAATGRLAIKPDSRKALTPE